MQNFVRTYIASQSRGSVAVQSNVQRYPKSPIYADELGTDTDFLRYSVWKWVAAVVIAIALLIPLLNTYITVVREREMRMADLLQISGMLTLPYYLANMIVLLALGSVTM